MANEITIAFQARALPHLLDQLLPGMQIMHAVQSLASGMATEQAAAGIEKHQQNIQSPSALGSLKRWQLTCCLRMSKEGHSQQRLRGTGRQGNSDSQSKPSNACSVCLPYTLTLVTALMLRPSPCLTGEEGIP